MEPKHLLHKRGGYISRLRKARAHHRILFYFIGSLGAIFVWKGFWDLLEKEPFRGHPIELLIIGIVLAGISGALFRIF